MGESGRGSIINMSSISSKVGFVGETNNSPAKAGSVGLSKAAAKEVAHLGVRVNVIQSGLIRTDMTEAMPAHVWEQKLAEEPMHAPANRTTSHPSRCSTPQTYRPT
jgi:3-oxoacyl-[acyl-carrier protein] reductase